jgi:hypothetical protein
VATICGVWILAALFCVPSARLAFVCLSPETILRNIVYFKRVITFEVFVFCVFPLFVIAFSYIMAARHLVKGADLMSEGTQNPQLKARKNVVLFVLGLTVVFVISYVPLYATKFYMSFILGPNVYLIHLNGLDSQSVNAFRTEAVSWFLILINSSLNPVVLFCTSLAFRKHLKRYLCCCCKANFPPNDIELRRRRRGRV